MSYYNKYLKYKKKYLDFKQLIGGAHSSSDIIKLLIACSVENRIPIIDAELDDDMPELEPLNDPKTGLPYIDVRRTDFEKNKIKILDIISDLSKVSPVNINYQSVDPMYNNILKKEPEDDIRYLGNIRSNFIDLPDSEKYDYILIMGCLVDFFIYNVDKMKNILKPDGYILIFNSQSVRPYTSFTNIEKHFRILKIIDLNDEDIIYVYK